METSPANPQHMGCDIGRTCSLHTVLRSREMATTFPNASALAQNGTFRARDFASESQIERPEAHVPPLVVK